MRAQIKSDINHYSSTIKETKANLSYLIDLNANNIDGPTETSVNPKPLHFRPQPSEA